MIKLTTKQQQALDIVKSGKNLMLSGKAGTGKSFLVAQITKHLKSEFKSFALTASTGIAAVSIKGITIHSYMGTGIQSSLAQVLNGGTMNLSIPSKKVIILDEVSMIDGVYMDMIDGLLRLSFNPELPFGGRQMILIGDLEQLPPVEERQPLMKSKAMTNGNFHNVFLDEIIRQTDPEFQKHLDNIRNKDYNKETLAYFNQRVGADIENFIELDPYNKGVYHKNRKQLDSVPGKTRWYNAILTGPDWAKDKFKKMSAFDASLPLKTGCRVMITKNNNKLGIVNGDLGCVVGQRPCDGACVAVKVDRTGDVIQISRVEYELKDRHGKTVATAKQLPIKLGYALSIHKSQGQTLSKAKLSVHTCFEPNMLYVALSRVRELEDMSLVKPITEATIRKMNSNQFSRK